MDASSFDFVTGLGTVAITLGGTGSHFIGAFFDHEIDQHTNTFFNEFGAVSGIPAAGQSWELDDPMFGDIFAHLGTGALDNTNAVPAGVGNDVSMALGWDFTLAAGETAVVHFRVSDSAVPVGFFLTQTDPDSPATLYFSSTLTIQGGSTSIPEPGTWVLMGSGLLGLVAWVRKQQRQRTCKDGVRPFCSNR